MTYIVKDVIDKVFIDKDTQRLKLVLMAILFFAVLKQVGFILKEYVYPYALFKVLKKLREEIYLKIISAKYSAVQRFQFGDILSRATNDIEAFKHSMVLVGVDFITQVFTVVAMVGILLYRDYVLFMIFLVATPIFVVSFNYFGKKRRKYSQKVQESFSEYTQVINQTLSGFETVKLFSKEIILPLFRKVNQNFFKNQRKNALYDVLYLSSLEIASYVGVAGIILYGGFSIINGRITTGDLFSFLSALLILVNSLQVLQRGAMQIKVLSPTIERIKRLINLEAETSGSEKFDGLKEKISFENVRLEMDNRVILEDINIDIKRGEVVGVVGTTGSGKSSFLKLLYGLYQDYQGKIFIDNIEMRQIDILSYRQKIGVVTQDVFMFNDTIRNNLLIANPQAGEEDIRQAVIKAKANFVFSLPNGLDTVVGERGSILSGGEKQRLAFARLFLANPDIVIIDEGTSALDMSTEESLMEEFYTHFEGKTIIMVAHRLSTLKRCNRIITFENGKIVKIENLLGVSS